MTLRYRKFDLIIPSEYCSGHEYLFDQLSTELPIVYCGIYLNDSVYHIYIHTVNPVTPIRIKKQVEKIGCGVESISRCKKFKGVVISEHGEKLKAGFPKGKKRKDVVHVPTTTMNTKRLHVHNPNSILIGGDIYVKSETSVIDNYVFHAVWGSVNGMWSPMFWAGPTTSMESSPRERIDSETIAKLMEDQESTCIMCHSEVSIDPRYSNADVDHIIPLHIGGNNSIKNLQILCVPCHRRKSALERRKVRNNMVVPTSVKLEPGTMYVARDDSTGTICESIEFEERNPKEFLESREEGLFRLVMSP